MANKLALLCSYIVLLFIRVFFIFFYILSAIWFVVKWSFAPIMFLISIIIILPIGKFIVSSSADLDTEEIEEQDLPEFAWLWMEEESSYLLANGYKKGQLLRVPNAVNDHIVYSLSMINEEYQLGVGLNYAENLKDKNTSIRIADIAFAEFTLHCSNGEIIDFNNRNRYIFTLPREENRRCYVLFNTEVCQLERVVRQVSSKINSYTSKSILDNLLNDFSSVLLDEFNNEQKFGIKYGYIKLSDDKKKLRLTWKGAMHSALETLWPSFVYYEYKMQKSTKAFLESCDVDLNEVYEIEDGTIDLSSNNEITNIDTLEKGLKLVSNKIIDLVNYKPTFISFFFDEDENIESVNIALNKNKEYIERQYVASSQYTLNFYNKKNICEYVFEGIDFDNSELYEVMRGGNYSMLPSFKNFISLDDAIDIAKNNIPISEFKLTEAFICQEDNSAVIWNMLFISKTDKFHLVLLDAISGKVVESNNN